MAREYEKKVSRLIRLYDRLNSGRRLFLPDLAEEFGVSLRSLQRDVADLSAIEVVPIRRVELEKSSFYELVPEARKYNVSFRMTDMIVVMIALRMLEQFEGTGLVDYMGQLAKNIRDRLSQNVADHFAGFEKKIYAQTFFARNYKNKGEQFDEILTALLYQKKLRITYKSGDDKASTYVVRPYTLVTYKTGIYMIALVDHAPENASPSTFALERVSKVEKLEEHYELPPKWNPADIFPEIGIMPGKKESVEIHFNKCLFGYLKGIKWPSGTTLSPKNGHVLLKMTITVNDELVDWLLGFGPLAEVVSPNNLRQKIVDELTSTLKLYKN